MENISKILNNILVYSYKVLGVTVRITLFLGLFYQRQRKQEHVTILLICSPVGYGNKERTCRPYGAGD